MVATAIPGGAPGVARTSRADRRPGRGATSGHRTLRRRTFRRRALAAVLAALTVAAADAPGAAADDDFRYRALSRDEIVSELIGRNVAGTYASGDGFTETFGPDGASHYRDDGREAEGIMSFRDDAFCFSYPFAEMSGGCFIVWQRSANCYDFYAVRGDTPYAGLIERSLGIGWDARVWRTDAAGTCPAVSMS